MEPIDLSNVSADCLEQCNGVLEKTIKNFKTLDAADASIKKQRNAEYYAKNSEKIKERAKQYYRDHANQIAILKKDYRKKYYAEHKTEILEKQREKLAASKHINVTEVKRGRPKIIPTDAEIIEQVLKNIGYIKPNDTVALDSSEISVQNIIKEVLKK